MADNNSIVVPITIDAQKAEVTLQKFQTTLQTFTNNYSQTTSNIYQLSERSTWSFSKLATTIADTGFAFSNIKSVISSLANSYMSFTDTLSKMSQRTGIAAESLGGLKFAAEQSGANFDILSQGLKTFQQQLANAQNGKNTLGIDATTDTEEALMQFADRIKNMTSETQQVKAAMEAFGKAGYKLLPMLQEGREGIQKLKDEAKRLGLTLDEAAIQNGVKLTDATNRMRQSLASISNQIIANLAPSLISMMDGFAKFNAMITSWINQQPVFVSTLGKLTAGFMAFGAVARTIPFIFSAIVAHPVVAALASIAVTLAAIDQAIQPVPKEFDAVSDSMQRQRQETDDLVNADKQRIQRLKELEALSKRGGLNNQEVAEATTLVTELSARYGDLGINIDAASGKITGMGEATKKMYAQMIESRKIALQKELSELQANQTSLQIQRDNAYNKGGLTGSWEIMTGKRERDWDDYSQQIDALTHQIALVNQEIANVDKSIKDNTTSNIKGKTPAEIKREMEAQQNLAKYNDDMKKHYMSARERELAAIDEETAKYIQEYNIAEEEDVKGIDIHTDYNQRRLAYYDNPENMKRLEEQAASGRVDAQGRLADVRLLQKLRMQEERKAEVNSRYDTEEENAKKKAEQDALEGQKRRDELVSKGTGKSVRMLQAEREYGELYDKWFGDEQWQLTASNDERRDVYARMTAARRTIAEEQAKINERNGVTEAENKVNGLQDAINHKYASGDYTGIDELKKQLEAAKLELAKTVANVSGKAREEARTELNKQRAEYKTLSEKDGVSEDELAEKWKKVEEAEANYKTQDSKYSSAVGEIQAAQEERANNQISQAKQTIETATSQGTFSAWEVGSIGNNTARQQLDTMKKMLDELIKINKNTEEGAVVA